MSTPAPQQPEPYILPQSVIPRGLAYLIDTFVVAVLTAILMAAGVIKGGGLESFSPDAVREMLRSNSGFVVYLILFAYFLICEGLTGRTVGKVALGLRVLRLTDGGPCGWSRTIIRNLLRPLDLLFLGLPGALIVLVTPGRQRLGDLLGGTLVVRQITVPAAMAPAVPGLLRRCGSCGRLAPASGPCPGCSAPAPQTAPSGQPVGAAMLQPLAGMMAVGEAAAGVRAAAETVLAAESAYGTASAAESARIGHAAAPAADGAAVQPEAHEVTVRPVADEVSSTEIAGDPSARVEDAVGGAGIPESTPDDGSLEEPSSATFVHTDDAPDLSDDYVAAWRGLMAAVDKLRTRRADLDAALGRAGIPYGQVTAADSVLRELLDEVEPYLDADDDEAVLAAYMTRATGIDPRNGSRSPDG
jgi:uncharacterized RDD family membrane protein YckC